MKVVILIILLFSFVVNVYLYKSNTDSASRIFYAESELEIKTSQLYFLIEYFPNGFEGVTLEEFKKYLDDKNYSYKKSVEKNGTYIFIQNLTFRFGEQGHVISVSAKR